MEPPPADAKKDQDKPIPGPEPAGDEYLFQAREDAMMNPGLKVGRALADLVRKPVHWWRANVIEPNRGPKYYWYHRKYKKALPIDECYMDDLACIYEANLEYKRNFMVDRATLDLLRARRDNCDFWNLSTKARYYPSEYCQDIRDTYDREELNFFIKYGDMHYDASVVHAYNKQKHRMIMERRRAILAAKKEASENGEVKQ